jgi:hypothetical protein
VLTYSKARADAGQAKSHGSHARIDAAPPLAPGTVNKVVGRHNEVQQALRFRGRLPTVTARSLATPDALLGVVRQTRFRMLVQRGLNRAFKGIPWLLIYAILGSAYVKLADPPTEVVRWVMWGLSLPLLGILTLVLTTRREGATLEAAVRLDRVHGLEGRIANGVAFVGKVQRTALEDCALDDALASTYTLRPAQASPLTTPPGSGTSLACALVLAVLIGAEVRHTVEVQVVPKVGAAFEPFVLAADDQAYLEEEVAKMIQAAQQEDTQVAANQMNLLMADLKAGRLDRNTALERLAAIEQTLVESSELEREARNEGLSEVGAGLQKSKLTKPIGDALRQQRLADAERALRDLAKAIRSNKINKHDLERLRAALDKASQGNRERLQRLQAQRDAANAQREKLLAKRSQKQTPAEAASTERELSNTERELKRLARAQKKAESGAKQLSALDRELAQAANELMKELGKAAEKLERGAEQLNQTQKRELSDEEKQALKKQLQELKEMLRQSKSGGAERQKQLEKFRQRAAGGKGPKSQGDGKSGSEAPRLSLGQGQAGNLPIPVPGNGQSTPDGADKGTGSAPGHSPGTATDAKSTELKGKTHDVAAAGIDSGQGSSASEVVYGAAARGFSGADYRKVYTDYKTVAEEALTSDAIPSGYKFYVRRYFQLIRPQD